MMSRRKPTATAWARERAWTMVEVNVDHLVKLRERIKATFEERYGVKITYLPMVVRATVVGNIKGW